PRLGPSPSPPAWQSSPFPPSVDAAAPTPCSPARSTRERREGRTTPGERPQLRRGRRQPRRTGPADPARTGRDRAPDVVHAAPLDQVPALGPVPAVVSAALRSRALEPD